MDLVLKLFISGILLFVANSLIILELREDIKELYTLLRKWSNNDKLP